MGEILEKINGFVWGLPALAAILGVGLYLTVRTGFAQFSLLGQAFRSFARMLRKPGSKDVGVPPLQALCTALAATVGTGNLVGVAGAICLGGPGAVFWMWIGGLLGMVTKFCEATLAVRFRVQKGDIYAGGPMYTILGGMGPKWRPLAVCYAAFGLIAAFGVGNATQINAVVAAVREAAQLPGPIDWILGILLAGVIGTLLLGGGRGIGRAAGALVPVASLGYIVLCLMALAMGWRRIPAALSAILQGAFCPRAVTGGMLGSAFVTLRVGCARGVFTNEAGLGTASIAHAGAQVEHPCSQGLLGILEVFLDTIVICTLTALVILISGVKIPYGVDAGGSLTKAAFAGIFGSWVGWFLAAALCSFAIATVLGWGLYGIRCAEFLFGKAGVSWFILAQTATVIASAVMDGALVWQAAEILNGLMAIPNLISLAVLTPELTRLIREFKKRIRRNPA